MNNLPSYKDHVKNFYPENYKMDLSETMKAALSKGPPSVQPQSSGSVHNMQAEMQNPNAMPGIGYVTEKLYMLLQLYLQNKGWNPSVELLQCFSELKDSALLPSAAYLQVLANRLTLDTQGRLILRENGKIVLPFEHFANAVMLKHMSGPHGLHLSVDATVRAVVESYTIGRENFGMEKDFIIEVVQSCPSPACRYYKNHMGMGPIPFMDQAFQGVSPDFMHLPPHPPMTNEVDLTKSHSSQKLAQMQHMSKQQQSGVQSNVSVQQQQQQHQHQQQQQQQITAAIIQQQNRAIAQQNLEKFGNMSPMDKQRVLQQLDKKHYEVPPVLNPSQVMPPMPVLPPNISQPSNPPMPQQTHQQQQQQPQQLQQQPQQPQPQPTMQPQPVHIPSPGTSSVSSTSSSHSGESHKGSSELLRSNLESLESNKDLLALHNGAWGNQDNREGLVVGQDKIIRAFAELMRNMARMKTYIRPSMCKPYGKQSESLQKTLMDTIQLVQSLRNCLPAPHIPVSSWKSEDRHRKDTPELVTRVEN